VRALKKKASLASKKHDFSEQILQIMEDVHRIQTRDTEVMNVSLPFSLFFFRISFSALPYTLLFYSPLGGTLLQMQLQFEVLLQVEVDALYHLLSRVYEDRDRFSRLVYMPSSLSSFFFANEVK
jgi:hypothetical protein